LSAAAAAAASASVFIVNALNVSAVLAKCIDNGELMTIGLE